MLASLASPAWLLILVMVGIGKLLRHRGSFPANAHETLNRYVIDIALPALVLVSVQKLRFSADVAWLIVTPWMLLLISAGLIWLLARMLDWSRSVTGALLLCVPLGNTAFLGYPLTEAMIGPQATSLAVIYDQFGTFLLLSSYGLVIAAVYGEGAQPSLRAVAKRVMSFPPFLMLLLALMPIEWPEAMLQVAAMIAATLVPTSCLAVGLQLRLRLPRAVMPALSTGLAIKLLLAPLLTVAGLMAMGVGGDMLRVAVLQAAMPPMITAGALATNAGLDPELCAALVGIGMLVSLLTAPVLLVLAG